jgi:hypothetical protein
VECFGEVSLSFLIFVCALFNDAARRSAYVASDGRIINEL